MTQTKKKEGGIKQCLYKTIYIISTNAIPKGEEGGGINQTTRERGLKVGMSIAVVK